MLVLPKHGGDLAWARRHFAVPLEQWLDLSTGVSPWPWPVEQWPDHVFRQLPPQSLLELQEVAARHYTCAASDVLPVPGSQYAISLLPALVPAGSVAIPVLGYQEHAYAWQRAGHQLHYYRDHQQLCDWVETGRVGNVVVINPNNPTGALIPRSAVQNLQEKLAQASHGQGVLIVDEAFMDVEPTHSLAECPLPNTIVLRSFGKFFGLAGVRLGFVIARGEQWIASLARQMGPWSISHPAVWVAQRAMRDARWIDQQRRRINASSQQLLGVIQTFLNRQTWTAECRSGGLFVTIRASAEPLYRLFIQLAEQGILVRYGQQEGTRAWLRLGLSLNYERLEEALFCTHSKSTFAPLKDYGL